MSEGKETSMPTLDQDLEKHYAPVSEGLRVLSSVRTVPEVVAALSVLEPAVQTAERFRRIGRHRA